MITLTGFVPTAVTLIVQTIQGQSPRLLQVLDRTDRTPLLFGTFMATFTFALLVLGQVRGNAVPDVSVTISVPLVLVSACLFLRLLVTFRTALTTGGLVRTVGGELHKQIDILYQAQPDPALATEAMQSDRQGIGSPEATADQNPGGGGAASPEAGEAAPPPWSLESAERPVLPGATVPPGTTEARGDARCARS